MEQKSDLYQFIVQYKHACDGNSPTYRDMMRACGLSSISVVHYHLKKLARQGRIRLLRHKRARSIVVVGGTWVAPPPKKSTARSRAVAPPTACAIAHSSFDKCS